MIKPNWGKSFVTVSRIRWTSRTPSSETTIYTSHATYSSNACRDFTESWSENISASCTSCFIGAVTHSRLLALQPAGGALRAWKPLCQTVLYDGHAVCHFNANTRTVRNTHRLEHPQTHTQTVRSRQLIGDPDVLARCAGRKSGVALQSNHCSFVLPAVLHNHQPLRQIPPSLADGSNHALLSESLLMHYLTF
jgi:hypothetical protein